MINERQKQELNSLEKKNPELIDSHQVELVRKQKKTNSPFSKLTIWLSSFVYRLIISLLSTLIFVKLFSSLSSNPSFFMGNEGNYSFKKVDNEDDLSSSFFEFLKEYPLVDNNSKSILEENLSGSNALSRFKFDESKNRIENILFYGSPGAGKTHTAKEIAEKFSCGYFFASGGSFERLFVGSGAMKLETLMGEVKKFAKKNKNSKKPVFLIVDEVDSLGLKKSSMSSDTTLINTFLTEIDSLKKENVVVIGTTNDFKQMEEASVRPGRFSCKIEFSLPSNVDDIYKTCLLSVDYFRKEESILVEIFEEENLNKKSNYIQISKDFLRLLANKIFDYIETNTNNFTYENQNNWQNKYYRGKEKISVSIPTVANLLKSLIIEENKKFYQPTRNLYEGDLEINNLVFEKNCDFIEQRISRMF